MISTQKKAISPSVFLQEASLSVTWELSDVEALAVREHFPSCCTTARYAARTQPKLQLRKSIKPPPTPPTAGCPSAEKA